MSDDHFSQALVRLGEEASRIRQDRGAAPMKWPDSFREEVLELVRQGVRHGPICRATGLKSWTLYEWRRKSPGAAERFSELKVVSSRKESTFSRIHLRTFRGSEMTLVLTDLRRLLREGLV